MQTRSLLILTIVFAGAFFGRAAVMAATLIGDERPAPSAESSDPDDACINGLLAESLKDELAAHEIQKQKLAEDRGTLKLLSERVEKRIDELEALNKSISEVVDARATENQNKKSQVGAIYAQMKPNAASAIIGEMDPGFAAELLLAMNGESSSAILSALEPDRAYSITVRMANATNEKNKADSVDAD